MQIFCTTNGGNNPVGHCKTTIILRTNIHVLASNPHLSWYIFRKNSMPHVNERVICYEGSFNHPLTWFHEPSNIPLNNSILHQQWSTLQNWNGPCNQSLIMYWECYPTKSLRVDLVAKSRNGQSHVLVVGATLLNNGFSHMSVGISTCVIDNRINIRWRQFSKKMVTWSAYILLPSCWSMGNSFCGRTYVNLF